MILSLALYDYLPARAEKMRCEAHGLFNHLPRATGLPASVCIKRINEMYKTITRIWAS